ncbi:hypothetical protein SAMN05216577_13856, partial [Pseudomonas citronellolis]
RSLTPALSRRERGPFGVGWKFGVSLQERALPAKRAQGNGVGGAA